MVRTGGSPSRVMILFRSSMSLMMTSASGLSFMDSINCHNGFRRFPRGVLTTINRLSSARFSRIGMSRGMGSSRVNSASSVMV